MALRAKIIVVLRTEIIVSADSGDSTDSGDSSDSTDSVTILIFPVRAGFVTNLARSFVRLMFQAMWADVGAPSRKAAPGGVVKPACAGIILAARGVKQLLQLVDNWQTFCWITWNHGIGGISGIGGGHSCGVEIMALRAKIIVVLRTEIIVSADSGDSTDSGDSGDSTDSGWWDSFCFFHGWQYVKGLLCWGARGKGNTLLYI